MKLFVPEDFVVPLRLVHEQFVLRPLSIHDLVRDYDAVMSSARELRGIFGPAEDWPTPDLSLEQDLIDLGWHQCEFQRRTSFTYTVMRPDESQCLGCVYLYPTAMEGCDAEAYCWVRTSHARELDAVLFGTLQAWLRDRWPFRGVAYPGRGSPWPARRY